MFFTSSSEIRALPRLFTQCCCSFPSDGCFDRDFFHPENIWGRIFWREQLTGKGSIHLQSCHVRFFTACQRGHWNHQDHRFSRHGFLVILPLTINTSITSQWMNSTHSPCRDVAWGSCNIWWKLTFQSGALMRPKCWVCARLSRGKFASSCRPRTCKNSGQA